MTIPTPRRLKASPKARKYWQDLDDSFHDTRCGPSKPVYVLPGSREDVERMVETFMAAMASVPQPQAQEDHVGPSWEESKVIAGFASLGIRSRKERK